MSEPMLNASMAAMMKEYLDSLPDSGRMVEIGTGYGESTLFFSLSKPNWTIYTIDGFGMVGDGRVFGFLKIENYLDAKIHYGTEKNIIQIIGDSQSLKWDIPVDCIYIDADHRYEGVTKDFEIYSPFLKDNGIIFFDDYLQPNNPTNGVKKLVDEICGDKWELLFADITAVVKRKP